MYVEVSNYDMLWVAVCCKSACAVGICSVESLPEFGPTLETGICNSLGDYIGKSKITWT
jgi:hypothetical protein